MLNPMRRILQVSAKDRNEVVGGQFISSRLCEQRDADKGKKKSIIVSIMQKLCAATEQNVVIVLIVCGDEWTDATNDSGQSAGDKLKKNADGGGGGGWRERPTERRPID